MRASCHDFSNANAKSGTKQQFGANCMFNSTYSSASALDANQRAHAAIASNLAHINVPGFRRHVNIFESMLPNANANPNQSQTNPLNGIDLDENATDFTAGAYKSTERPLDVAAATIAFSRRSKICW